MTPPSSDLTALIARAEQYLSESARFKAATGLPQGSPVVSLVRDLLAALEAVEQREQALRDQLAEAERRAFGADYDRGWK